MFFSLAITEKADLFSFAMLLWLIAYNKSNFPICIPPEAILQEKRPEITSSCPNEVKEVIVKCWSNNPEERYSAAQVVSQLSIYRQYGLNAAHNDDHEQKVINKR